jgi:electron transfer flavoprotein beta subunit
VQIVVLVKEVPDTYEKRCITVETGLVDRVGTPAVVDEISERAAEAAITLAEANPGTTVTAVLMGPPSAEKSLRKVLAMGADTGVHIVDDALVGADTTLTAEVLAAAVRRCQPDLVLLGNASSDGGGGVLGAMLAELLDMPQLTSLSSIECNGVVARGTRAGDHATISLESVLPVVAAITESFPEGRFPSFRANMAAKRKPIEVISAADIGADVLGDNAARSIILAARQTPERAQGVKIFDRGDGGERLAEFLIERQFVVGV